MLSSTLLIAGALGGCTGKKGGATVKRLLEVDKMPDRAADYKLLDFRNMAIGLDAVLYDFANSETNAPFSKDTYGPIGYWDDSKVNVDYRVFGMPSYIGSPAAGQPCGQEAITVLASLWGASAVGIDKSSQSFGGKTYDFVKMAKQFYNSAPNNFILNNVRGSTGQSFWYEIYPFIQFIRLSAYYLEETWMRDIIIEGCNKWHDVLPNFKDTRGNISFDFVGYDFAADIPVIGTTWNEPPNGGLAMIFYTGYILTGDERYLDDVRYVLDYLEQTPKNPYYEILSEYAIYIGAIMNARHGCHYDLQNFANYIFDGKSDVRSGVQVAAGYWGDFGISGLMAFSYTYGGSGYAFAMNSWHLGCIMASLVRYDPRFADDVGKYLMHLASSSKVFFRDQVPDKNQSCPDGAACDPDGLVAYEGVKSTAHGQAPFACGDQTELNWGGYTDFGIYGGAHLGLLGAMFEATDVPEILKVDLCTLDTFKGDERIYMYYNPYDKEKKVTVKVDGNSMLYDTASGKVIADNVSGEYKLKVPAKKSVVLAILPAGTSISEKDGIVSAGDVFLKRDVPAVNILTPDTAKKTVKEGTEIVLSYYAPKGKKITEMKIAIGETEVYSGEPVEKFTLGSLKGIKSGVQNMRVTVTTADGLTDTATLRVRKL